MCLDDVVLDSLVLAPPVLNVVPVLRQLGVNTVQRLGVVQQDTHGGGG